ncbi:MAG TPA: ribbon-helix-helix domain-containing protein [Thermosynergistes sp.]|nr:ribbon-helix-helix domain-containing protein [Thermosynergistes sp.]
MKESRLWSVQLNLTYDQYVALKKLSKELDCGMSVIVRRAIDDYLEKGDFRI